MNLGAVGSLIVATSMYVIKTSSEYLACFLIADGLEIRQSHPMIVALHPEQLVKVTRLSVIRASLTEAGQFCMMIAISSPFDNLQAAPSLYLALETVMELKVVDG